MLPVTVCLSPQTDLPYGISTSIHALMGEAIRLKPSLFLPSFASWFPTLVKAVQLSSQDYPLNARNNAAWAVGRVAVMAAPQALAPWANELAKTMAKVMIQKSSSSSSENGDNLGEGEEDDDAENEEARNDGQYLRITWYVL